jgi:hypothetical protein
MDSEQLKSEHARGRPAGVAALAAAASVLAGWALALTVDRPDDNDPARLLHFDRHAGVLLSSYALRGLALGLVAVVAVHLHRATKARRPEHSRAVGLAGAIGAPLFAASTVATGIALGVIASDFVSSADHGRQAAHDALRDPVLIAFGAGAFAGEMALALWFVLGSLGAMRVGLLTRFMGVLGVLLGPLIVLMPSLIVDPMLAFWLAAMGTVFLRLRPVPPAWTVGEAVPWPTLDDKPAAAANQASGAPSNGEVSPVGPGVKRGSTLPNGRAAEVAAPGEAGRRRWRKR